MSNLFRAIPSVDVLLDRLRDDPVVQNLPRTLVKDLVNEFLQQCRKGIQQGRITTEEELGAGALLERLRMFVHRGARPHFRRVINATGVVVHTNLGRSLLSRSAVEAVQEACDRYSNLEFDLDSGKRGSRYSHVESILCRITGAEAGLVVNNNAAAVLLILDTLAKGKEVVVSRGELVEIGGSFRIPDVMAKSGAVLREVGATNRTHLSDYENAIGPETAALMKVHTSNFRIMGFHKAVSIEELSRMAAAHSLPVIEDLGSGNLFSFDPAAGLNEPTVQDSLAAGADVVSFSGDKLLGGPQAGIILGNKLFIDAVKKNPLNRALRIDKMTLAALEATLRIYLEPDAAGEQIPTLRMITATPRELASRAGRLAGFLRRELKEELHIKVIPGVSRVGGGALPEKDLLTSLVALDPVNGRFGVEQMREALLKTNPPVVGRIEHDMFCLDPRTLLKGDFQEILSALKEALAMIRAGADG
ncbi:MAG: L-seryl-tRNA(Sec) selenium transferase [Desulfovibrionales bacterium]